MLNEGETVTFTKEEVAEYDKDYFDTLFEAVGAEETEDGEDKPKTKSKGKKSEETAE